MGGGGKPLLVPKTKASFVCIHSPGSLRKGFPGRQVSPGHSFHLVEANQLQDQHHLCSMLQHTKSPAQMPRSCASETSPHLFPLNLEGAQALTPLCKIWMHTEASCPSLSLQGSGSTGLTGTASDWAAAHIQVLLGADTEHRPATARRNRDAHLPKTGFHICTHRSACTSLERCNRKGREKEGKPFPPCPQSAPPLLESHRRSITCKSKCSE